MKKLIGLLVLFETCCASDQEVSHRVRDLALGTLIHVSSSRQSPDQIVPPLRRRCSSPMPQEPISKRLQEEFAQKGIIFIPSHQRYADYMTGQEAIKNGGEPQTYEELKRVQDLRRVEEWSNNLATLTPCQGLQGRFDDGFDDQVATPRSDVQSYYAPEGSGDDDYHSSDSEVVQSTGHSWHNPSDRSDRTRLVSSHNSSTQE